MEKDEIGLFQQVNPRRILDPRLPTGASDFDDLHVLDLGWSRERHRFQAGSSQVSEKEDVHEHGLVSN
jgi:hypothetical protein